MFRRFYLEDEEIARKKAAFQALEQLIHPCGEIDYDRHKQDQGDYTGGFSRFGS